MLGQPDSLQPDDEHELQATSRQSQHQRGDVAHGESPRIEEMELKHGLFDLELDENEHREDDESADDA